MRAGVAAGRLGAALLLAALVGGVPLALVELVPLSLPRGVPTWDAVWSFITGPDDLGVILGALAVLAWGLWGVFAVSLLAEAVGRARGVRVPSIPLLGWLQRSGAWLLTAAGLFTATGGPMPSTPSAPAVVAMVEHDVSRVPSGDASPAQASRPVVASPVAAQSVVAAGSGGPEPAAPPAPRAREASGETPPTRSSPCNAATPSGTWRRSTSAIPSATSRSSTSTSARRSPTAVHSPTPTGSTRDGTCAFLPMPLACPPPVPTGGGVRPPRELHRPAG